VSDREAVHRLLATLAAQAAPPGRESEMDAYLRECLADLGPLSGDPSGNLVLRLGPADGPADVALAAHKDEIAAAVKKIEDDGRLRVVNVGDAHPWIWGEGPLVLLGDREAVPGVLSFGSRHVSEASKQRAQLDDTPVRWRDVWVETKRTPEELAAAGVHPGTRAVLPAARHEPILLGADDAFLAAPALDDRVGIAILILLAERIGTPARPLDLVFTSREEVGCHGLQYYARRAGVDTLVAVEVAPVAEEYGLQASADPVLIQGDARGILNDALSGELAAAAERSGIALQHCVLARYGSDASTAYAAGLVGRAACLAAAVDNTHGCEIVHLDAVTRCVDVLAAWLD
jgi:putative aminopeptidase FrvX